MSEIIISDKHEVPTVSSLDVARDFGKRHDNVIRDIENLERSLSNFGHTPGGGLLKIEDTPLFYEATYLHPQNQQFYKCYDMTRDGFALLVMGFTGKKALAWKLKYIQAFNEMEQRVLTNAEKHGTIDNRTNVLFDWYENISASYFGDISDINSYAKALDLADYSIAQLSALVKYLLQKTSRNEEIIMQYGNFELDSLKGYLPQYVEQFTQKRRKSTYNCPFCGSGTGKNKTPAFGLYDNDTKFKCQSCGVQGSIIDFYLMIHHMGNSREETAQAIQALSEEFHLTTTPFSPPQPQTPKVKIGERHHIYKNADGSIFGKKVVNKYSDGNKDAVWHLFNQNTGSFNDNYGLKGQKAPLYNADLLYSNQDEPVYIVEGEKDADTLTNWNAVATTFPNGAGFKQWIPLYNEGLQGREIIILTDNDDSGRKYGDTVARNVLPVAKSVKVIPANVIWNKCPEKGDISDIVQAVGEEEAQELLIDAINKADFYTPESLPLSEEINKTSASTQQKIEYSVIQLSEVKPEPQEFLWNPYLPIGEITVMYAAGGTGKSFATIGIASDITIGRTLPRYGTQQSQIKPEKVLFISAEDNESMILNRMKEANGKPENCYVLKTPRTRKELDTESFLLPQNKDDTARIQAFANLLEKIQPKLVIIDPWSVYIGDDKNMNKANDVRGVTNVLTVLAKEFHCAILVVAHVNKMPQTENANNAVSGSTALIDSARSAICVRSFGADSDRRVMIQTKSNYQRKAKSVCYRIISQGETRTARFEWDGFSDLTEDDLTKSARSGKSLSDIENDHFDDAENKKIAIEIIKRLAVYGQSINISYDRFREEIKAECGEDFLPKRPQKFMNSLVSDLRSCGIGIELKKVKSILSNGECDTVSRTGFVIHYMTNGHLMAEAMPQ